MAFNYKWRILERVGSVLTVLSVHHIDLLDWFSAHHILDICTKKAGLDSSFYLYWILMGYNITTIFICPKSEITWQKIHQDWGHCGGLTLAGWGVPTKATLVTPLLSRTGKRKHSDNLMARERNREISFHVMGKNRSALRKLIVFVTNQSRVMRNKTKS